MTSPKPTRGVGEIHFALVAEAARDRAFGAEPDAAGAGVEAEVAGEQAAVGIVVRIGDIADVILEPAADLEAPAGFLVLQLRRALPRRRGLGLCAWIASIDSCSASTCACSSSILACAVVDRLGLGDGRVGGGVRLIGLGRLGRF